MKKSVLSISILAIHASLFGANVNAKIVQHELKSYQETQTDLDVQRMLVENKQTDADNQLNDTKSESLKDDLQMNNSEKASVSIDIPEQSNSEIILEKALTKEAIQPSLNETKKIQEPTAWKGLSLPILTWSDYQDKHNNQATLDNLNSSLTVSNKPKNNITARSARIGGDSSPISPVSIPEMARALQYNVDNIYEYVSNNIEYTPGFESSRGALGTLIDNQGNALDQAALMVALLRESGYQAEYQYGTMTLNAQQMEDWFGFKAANTCSLLGFFSTVQIPIDLINGQAPTLGPCDSNIAVSNATFGHVWVKTTIDGSQYVFDPSYKTYSKTAPINMETSIGYTPSSFLTTARNGAVITSDSAKNINRGNIRSYLTAYSNYFISYLNSNKPAATLDDVIGGKKLNEVINFPRVSNLENANPPRKLYNEFADLSVGDSSILNVQYQGINQSFTSEFIYGKRLTITFNASSQPELRLDGTIYGTPGTAIAPGTSTDLTLSVIHNRNTALNHSFVSKIKAGGTYAIANSWGYSSRGLTSNFRNQIEKARSNGILDDSEQLKGLNLAFLGAQWTTQSSALAYMISKINKSYLMPYHQVGVVGFTQDGKTYVDLPSSSYITASEAVTEAERRLDSYRNMGLIGRMLSILESTTVQQVTGAPAASTLSTMDDVIASGGRIFKATSSNYNNAVKPYLNYCNINHLNNYANLVNNNYNLILPEYCQISKGIWSGNSYWAYKLNGSQSEWMAKIDGYSGGYSGVVLTAAALSNNTSKLFSYNDIMKATGEIYNDPIDLTKGSFLLSNDDLNVGVGVFPQSLSFNRLYTSDNATQDKELGRGWTHNYNQSIFQNTDGFQSLGEDSAIDASGVLSALTVLSDLEKDNTYPVDKEAIKIVVAAWLGDQLVNNTMIVQDGLNGQVFVKLANETYNSPPGNSSKLIKNTDGTYTLESSTHAKTLFNAPGTSSNTQGKAVSYTEPSGLQVKYNYDSEGKLSSLSNSLGRQLILNYSGSKISNVTDGIRSVNYIYDNSSNLIGFKNTLGQQTNYQYDLPGRMTQIYYPNNPNNAAVSNVYDSLGRIAAQTNALGKTFLYGFAGSRSFEISPEITKLDGTKEQQVHVNYMNANGQITWEKDPLSRWRQRIFDGQSRIIKQIEPEGNSVEYTYTDGSCNTSWGCTHNIATIKENPKPNSGLASLTTKMFYDSATNKISSYVDARGNTTSYLYNSNGTLNKITYPLDNQSARQEKTYTYINYTPSGFPTFSLPSSTTEKINSTTSTTSTTTYDVNNKYVPSTITIDAGGLNLTTTLTHDNIGNLTKVDGPRTDVNDVTTTLYNSERFAIQTTDALGKMTKKFYDYDGKLVLSASQLGSQWMVSCNIYSSSRKVLRTLGPVLQSTVNSCPSPGNPTQVTDYAYDEVDRQNKIINYPTDYSDDIRTTQTVYNLDNTVQSIKKAVGSNLEQYYTQYVYTANGKPQWSIDALGNATRTTYDGLDRPKEIAYSTSGIGTLSINPNDTESFAYDENSNVIQYKTRSGASVNKTYDRLNRLTQINYPAESASNRSYQYNLLNQKTSAFGGVTGAINYTYDKAGRLVSVVSNGKTIGYEYDTAGNRTKIIWPDTNFSVTTSYDVLNRPSVIKENGNSNLASYSYDDLSRRATVTLGNGTTTTSTYNSQNQLSTLKHTLSGTAQDVQFTYERNRIGDLVGESWSNDQYQWNGISPANTNYSRNGLNQYTAIGNNAVTYDTNGNLATDGTGWAYNYDLNNRLVSAVKSGSGAVSGILNYDSEGNLARTSISGITTDLIYDGTDLIAEYNGTAIARRYVHGPGIDEPLVWYEGSGTSNKNWIYSNQLGSVVALANASGANTAVYTYGPFGEPSTSAGNMRFRYTGQTQLAELGLYYYKARMYSPTLGRFLQTDPIGQKDDMNLYAYVGNNSINSIDPTGMFEAKMLMDLNYAKQPFSYDNLSSASISISVGANTTPVRGVGGGAGIYATTGTSMTGSDHPDIGLFVTGSKSIGFGAGAGVGVDYWKEGRNNFDGQANTSTICFLAPCFSIHTNDKNERTGYGFSIGGSTNGGAAPGGSFTHSKDSTKSLTIGDLFKPFAIPVQPAKIEQIKKRN